MSTSSQRSWKAGRSAEMNSGGGTSSGSERGHAASGNRASNNEKGFENEDRETVTVMDMVTMLGCADQKNAQRILLAMAGSAESCQALRKSGCIPLLIQMLHPINVPLEDQPTQETKLRAAQTLNNIVQFNCDEKMKRKEIRVLKLLESLRSYIDYLKNRGNGANVVAAAGEKHPVPSSMALMKLSFDEDHKKCMCFLGAIHTLADLIQTDHAAHGINENSDCITMRRYNGMTLTNLTFGDKRNKLLLGTMKDFMVALVAQLSSPSEDVSQAAASVLRNLSWQTSSALKASLVDSNAVRKLMIAAINAKKESTLKSTLSALWNLSSHSDENTIAICQTPNAIDFLVSLLESRTLPIVENAGGILTNISIVAAADDATSETFRSCGILEILLDHLQSSSILIVGNACGILWHLSDSEQNQQRLYQLGAVRKLKVLAGSKHERIKHAASSTLRNILSCPSNELPGMASPLPMIAAQSQSAAPDQQQPMDLRTTVSQPTTETASKPTDLHFTNEPLDLSFHSSKSTPIHTVSEREFGPRIKTVPFLNPPLHNKNACSYDSPKNYNSCPEFVHFIQPAHKSSPIDFSQGEEATTIVTDDATINYSLHYTEPEDPVTITSVDTLKTYYCEGTPLNFSTSNSMTDLTQMERPTKLKPIRETETTDDTPRNYCTESTPATFSRTSSLSSIASNLQGGENKAEYLEETPPKVTNGGSKEKGKRNVTFSAADTPLMFSRTSSVNSLDSVEINYEDAGSVVSDFSRRQSEAVSPSELPDSPRQIVPPQQMPFNRLKATDVTKPKEEEMDAVKVFATTGESCAVSGAQSVRSLSPLTIEEDGTEVALLKPMKLSNNEMNPVSHAVQQREGNDEMKVFGVEDTPWRGVSTATSLSDLVDEFEKEIEAVVNEKPLEPSSPPPPPLPPKPNSFSQRAKAELPTATVNQTTNEKADNQKPEVPPARIPKSKSELSKLNTKAMKMSTSYSENLKPESQLDPELAALIMKGKSRVRGNKASIPKHSPSGKSVEEKKDNVKENSKQNGSPVAQTEVLVEKTNSESLCKSTSSGDTPQKLKSKKVSQIQQSTTSLGSEWNDDTLSLSVPSLSINAAFKLVQSTNSNSKDEKPKPEIPAATWILEGSAMFQSTISNVEPPTDLSLVSSTGCKKSKVTSNESNLINQKPPPEFDLDSSMISVASLKTEMASIGPLEEGMKDLSIGGETYTIGGGGSDLTDAEDSFFDDTESLEVKVNSNSTNEEKRAEQTGDDEEVDNNSTPPLSAERFKTYTAKKHSSPREKRREDPGRYLTRTISPHTPPPRDTNGNHSPSPTYFSTFKVDRTPRIVKPSVSATSNESSPTSSPTGGIRGRRKQLYCSLPSQKRFGPPIPPKPANGGVHVRPTRTSELRAASSRDSSPKQSKNSSKNSSTTSLNNSIPPVVAGYQRKTPPKPPVRTTTSKNFAVVRAVRNSNSSIGFTSEPPREVDSGHSTLPRSLKLKPLEAQQSREGTKVGKLTNLWNQLTKANSKDPSKPSFESTQYNNGGIPGKSIGEKKPKFGFNFGRKKKATADSTWISRPENNVPASNPNELRKGASINFNNRITGEPTSGGTASGTLVSSKMTPV